MNINWPKISIITPSFNQGGYIESTILSVINQGYPNLEFIIIDGGSVDNTVSVIKKYESKISYWVSEPDNGQSDAINKGFQRVTGDIVNWLNSDDELAPNSLFEIGKAFIENPECTCCVGRIEMFNQSGVIGTTSSVISPLLEQCIGFGKVNQPSMYFSTKCHKKIGMINSRMNYLMDTEWYLRYLLAYGNNSIVDVDKVFSRFRYHDESKTVSQAEKFRFERDSMYYSLAKQFELFEYAEFIKNYGKVNVDFEFNIPNELISFNKEKSINYFVYQLGLEYYHYRVMNKAEKCLKFVNQDLLLESEVEILKSRLMKIKFVPNIVWKIKK
ncbi:MAG TPA: glycosyltransferase family 2 protein [Bacteroidia bacterium]|nr:glycosyltransferase family 2 protein [Bacteroidia bacterium]